MLNLLPDFQISNPILRFDFPGIHPYSKEMKLILLALAFLASSLMPSHAHCGKCKADGSEMVKRARQVR